MLPPVSDPPAQQRLTYRTPRIATCLGASALFVISCMLPAMAVVSSRNGARDEVPGVWLLGLGWMGPLLHLMFGWFANPLFLVSMIKLLRGRYQSAFRWGLATVGVGLLSLYWPSGVVPVDEGGGDYYNLLHPSIGFYVWMGSLALIPTMAYRLWKAEPR